MERDKAIYFENDGFGNDSFGNGASRNDGAPPRPLRLMYTLGLCRTPSDRLSFAQPMTHRFAKAVVPKLFHQPRQAVPGFKSFNRGLGDFPRSRTPQPGGAVDRMN